jgi:osmotically-inducible protein OsmY
MSMTRAAALLITPARDYRGADEDTFQATDRLLSQSLEDLRLAERVEHALHATGYGSLRAVVVSVSARVVALLGRVSSYYLKQIAQETALAVPGAHQIHNGLDVVRRN